MVIKVSDMGEGLRAVLVFGLTGKARFNSERHTPDLRGSGE
jgi:hypothetical protein